MKTCSTRHQYHATERSALNHLAWARMQPGGKGIKHLNVFSCQECGGWHVGRSRRGYRERLASMPKAELASKPLTPGQQRRAERKAAERAVHDKLFADYTDTLRICKILVDRELARYAALGIKPRTVEHNNERDKANKA